MPSEVIRGDNILKQISSCAHHQELADKRECCPDLLLVLHLILDLTVGYAVSSNYKRFRDELLVTGVKPGATADRTQG